MNLSSFLSTVLLGVGFRRRNHLRLVGDRMGGQEGQNYGRDRTRPQPPDVVQSRPQLVTENKNVIKLKGLDVARFVQWVNVTGQGGLVSSNRAVQLYRQWCGLRGRAPAPRNEFLSMLSKYAPKQRLWVQTQTGTRRRLTFYQLDMSAYV